MPLSVQGKFSGDYDIDSMVYNQISKPSYYNDSLQKAFFLRIRNVVAKQGGYKLLDTEVVLISSGVGIKKEAPYIEDIRNIRDTLFIEVRFYMESKSKIICGIDLDEENSLDLRYENYHLINDDLLCFYSAKYVVLKRKFSRLHFKINGIPLSSI